MIGGTPPLPQRRHPVVPRRNQRLEGILTAATIHTRSPEIFFDVSTASHASTGLPPMVGAIPAIGHGRATMTQSDPRGYVHLWTKDRNAFDRWMKACAVVGSIFAAAVLIMAL